MAEGGNPEGTEGSTPQLNEATLKAIINGVAAKLQATSSGGDGRESRGENAAGGRFFPFSVGYPASLHPADVKSLWDNSLSSPSTTCKGYAARLGRRLNSNMQGPCSYGWPQAGRARIIWGQADTLYILLGAGAA